jgi:hypothetical protein
MARPPQDFLQLFGAVVAVERRQRAVARVTVAFKGVSRRPLELLDDPKLRVRAPVLPEIEQFFIAQRDKIVRGHVAQSTHSWKSVARPSARKFRFCLLMRNGFS